MTPTRAVVPTTQMPETSTPKKLVPGGSDKGRPLPPGSGKWGGGGGGHPHGRRGRGQRRSAEPQSPAPTHTHRHEGGNRREPRGAGSGDDAGGGGRSSGDDGGGRWSGGSDGGGEGARGGNGRGGGGGGGGRGRKAKSKSPTPPTSQARRRGGNESRSPVPPSPAGRRKANQSRSPTRKGKSKSPMRKGKSKSPTPPSSASRRHHHHRHHHRKGPADMTVVVSRADVYDTAAAAAQAAAIAAGTAVVAADGSVVEAEGYQPAFHYHPQPHHHHHPPPPVAPYRFRSVSMSSTGSETYYTCLSEDDGFLSGGGLSSAGSEAEAATVASATSTESPVPAKKGGGGGGAGGARKDGLGAVAVARAPHRPPSPTAVQLYWGIPPEAADHYYYQASVDNKVPNPHDPRVVHDKYWAQRRRLFSRFDQGIQLDGEGWYSVTPEKIADHVAGRLAELASMVVAERAAGSLLSNPYAMTSCAPPGIVVLDAFCGCGGNTIAFGKLPPSLVSLIVCVDIDRTKLRMAAHNASLYGITTDRLLFIHSNSLDIMEKCYRNGELIPPEYRGAGAGVGAAMMAYQPYHLCGTSIEWHAGFAIGGPELLPPHIDAVFMDPPWGGIDYSLAGKNGYDLARHMRIRRSSVGPEFAVPASASPGASPPPPPSPPAYGRSRAFSASTSSSVEDVNGYESAVEGAAPVAESAAVATNDGELVDGFFDSFDTGPPKKKEFVPVVTPSQDSEVDSGDCVDGVDLLRMAAAATGTRLVLYDLPRNTNKTSLGQAALAAGYRGNIKLEEHYLNGRLKTVTAYLGSDYSGLLH